MYIVKHRITFEKLTEMIKTKIDKRIIDGKKLTLHSTDSSFYPFEKDCNSFQEIWLSDNEYIKLKYKNV